ncbi:Hsp70 family protein [Kutzneria albida]|uniref:Uncharacterized protein n=1 Tax=Kutzneria albida DSM 43870 TaxID=1449976 RepID=W5WFJ9_9PSEU|nr:Hsp70 family protein [Kutzneria albida]AHH99612.1 hypothetical protein KALB_6252 [Kutzneria albida DSM 43870]
MSRQTVDFGIDLGTTTSAIAVSTGAGAEVVRDAATQRDFTPSAVYVSKNSKVFVGDKGRERAESDPDNACVEFKLQMGMRGTHKHFAAAGRDMSPEELSAEVLKSLRGNVQQATGEAISASVITVPAAFELDQCDATRRAAALAGLEFAPLLQEPTAAAWAYSVHHKPERGFWLVYDFGGGTFDAAVVSFRDGEFVVVNHEGDNFLGGKLIDWALVEQVLIPAAREEYGLTGLSRGDARWRGTVAKLKQAAENAKIHLSTAQTVEVDVQLDPPGGERVDFTWELTRADVERASMPLYRSSIELCRRALTEKGLAPGDIERVLLVGGTTIAPGLRALVADPTEGLGIPVDHSLDPVTVVAKGAAIFASTQRVPHGTHVAAPGEVVLEMEHEPVGQDLEPLAGGRLRAEAARDWSGWTIEFVNEQAQPVWRSGQVAVSGEGTFATRLAAVHAATSAYQVLLRDQHGTQVPTVPATVEYRHSVGPLGTSTVLSHSVGVWLEGNEVQWLLRKGTELPASKQIVLHSTVDVRRNTRSGLIRVPIVEGERSRADRNTLIGRLDIRADEVKRDVPAGSEVEVHLRIDRSFTPRADAYVPLLDAEFDIQVELGRSAAPDVAELREEARELVQRHGDLRARATQFGATDAGALLDRFDRAGVLKEVQGMVAALEVDLDAVQTCQVRLRDAQNQLDEVEEALVLPEMISHARALVQQVREMAKDWGEPGDQRDLTAAASSVEDAIAAGDRSVLQRQMEVVRGIGLRILRDTGRLDAVIFGQREAQLSGSSDPQVQRVLAEGRLALDSGDGARLRQVNRQLDALLPEDETTADVFGMKSTVTMGDRR